MIVSDASHLFLLDFLVELHLLGTIRGSKRISASAGEDGEGSWGKSANFGEPTNHTFIIPATF